MSASQRFVFSRSADEDSGGAALFLLRAPALHHQAERCIQREKYGTHPVTAASLRNICLTHTAACKTRHIVNSRRGRGRRPWQLFKKMSLMRLVKHVLSVRCSSFQNGMRTMSGCVFIIDKRCPEPRLMSGQIYLTNYTFYVYDLQHVGLGSTKNKAARSRVGRLCEINE